MVRSTKDRNVYLLDTVPRQSAAATPEEAEVVEMQPPRGPRWHGGEADTYVFDRMMRPNDSQQSSDDEDDDSANAPLKLPPVARTAKPRRGGAGSRAAGRDAKRPFPPAWDKGTTLEESKREAHFAFRSAEQAAHAVRREARLGGVQYFPPQHAEGRRQRDLRVLRHANVSVAFLGQVDPQAAAAASASEAAAAAVAAAEAQAATLRRRRRPRPDRPQPRPPGDEEAPDTQPGFSVAPTHLPRLGAVDAAAAPSEFITVRAMYRGKSKRFRLSPLSPAPTLAQLEALLAQQFNLSLVPGAHRQQAQFTATHFLPPPLRLSGVELRLADNAMEIKDDGGAALAVKWALGSLEGVLSLNLLPARPPLHKILHGMREHRTQRAQRQQRQQERAQQQRKEQEREQGWDPELEGDAVVELAESVRQSQRRSLKQQQLQQQRASTAVAAVHRLQTPATKQTRVVRATPGRGGLDGDVLLR